MVIFLRSRCQKDAMAFVEDVRRLDLVADTCTHVLLIGFL